jgi:hypothetical protein
MGKSWSAAADSLTMQDSVRLRQPVRRSLIDRMAHSRVLPTSGRKKAQLDPHVQGTRCPPITLRHNVNCSPHQVVPAVSRSLGSPRSSLDRSSEAAILADVKYPRIADRGNHANDSTDPKEVQRGQDVRDGPWLRKARIHANSCYSRRSA